MNLSGHPLMTDTAQFITLQMVRALKLSIDRVMVRRSAVLFEGAPRVGKSRCSEFVAAHLKSQLPNALVIYHIARVRERGRRPSVLAELCVTEKTKPAPRGVDHLDHLLAYIEGHVTGQADPQCVLIIDEIQLWRQYYFELLSCLHNYLKREGISLELIEFAQSEIYDKLSGLHAIGKNQLVARFFSEIIPYRGCQNIEDLTTILQACDDGSEFPIGSGISYTAFFAPKAFAAGFRLGPLAGLLWKMFDGEVTGKYVKNLPMQHVRESIVDLLQLIAPHDSALFEVDEKIIREAVHRSGIRMFCDAL